MFQELTEGENNSNPRIKMNTTYLFIFEDGKALQISRDPDAGELGAVTDGILDIFKIDSQGVFWRSVGDGNWTRVEDE